MRHSVYIWTNGLVLSAEYKYIVLVERTCTKFRCCVGLICGLSSRGIIMYSHKNKKSFLGVFSVSSVMRLLDENMIEQNSHVHFQCNIHI